MFAPRFMIGIVLLFQGIALACAEDIHILYAEQQVERPAVLSGLHPVPEDLGLQGARLAIRDNNTTGKFTGQTFVLDEVIAKPDEQLSEKIKPLLASHPLVVLNSPAQALLAIADLPEANKIMLLNAGAPDDALRDSDCRSNVLHVLPSTSMLTDALAQFFVIKKWQKWMLITGNRDSDKAYATDIKASAEKFGISIVAEKGWDSDADMRESAAVEVPLMTQDSDYDAIVIADANNDFGSLIGYNSYYARPVAGTNGLVPTMWTDVIEPWGAIQLQNAFLKQARRGMRDVDFAAYLSVRLVGEAATRTKSAEVNTLRSFMLSPDLQMQAYKGRGLSFRTWNGQLRQPIHLVTKDTQVAMAPFEEFLHEGSELDTLGRDQQESQCKNYQP